MNITPERVTIIVLNWNRKDDTFACLASLQQAELGGAAILVVDNGSHDGSVEAIRTAFPHIRVLALPENRGYAGGNNAGIRDALDAAADAVLILNNDTEVAPDFLTALLWAINEDPMTGAASSAVFRMDRPEMLDVAYAGVVLDHREVVRIHGVNALPGQGFDQRKLVEVAVGCSLLIRAEALRRVGLFDERFFAYHEEVDWCLRARQAGYLLAYEPHSRVYHRGSSSTTHLWQRPQQDPTAVQESQLPNAEPPMFNPVRAYLGARNTIRLVRSYATPEQRRKFVRSTLYEGTLEFLAIVMNREGMMTLQLWSYPQMFRYYFHDRHRLLRHLAEGGRERALQTLAQAAFIPVDLLWSLPRDVWRAYRLGRLAQFAQYLRGLRDGWLDRPLPLKRLGLQ